MTCLEPPSAAAALLPAAVVWAFLGAMVVVHKTLVATNLMIKSRHLPAGHRVQCLEV